ncbi:MAG: hypothetical protein ABI833_08385 [Acidobacteriota bacterium]
MKTTLEIPDPILRKAKAKAAERGIPLRQFVTEAVQEKLAGPRTSDKPWMEGACKLRHLHAETVRIQRFIDEEFGQIEPEDRL